jgi:hypothetical protein
MSRELALKLMNCPKLGDVDVGDVIKCVSTGTVAWLWVM